MTESIATSRVKSLTKEVLTNFENAKIENLRRKNVGKVNGKKRRKNQFSKTSMLQFLWFHFKIGTPVNFIATFAKGETPTAKGKPLQPRGEPLQPHTHT